MSATTTMPIRTAAKRLGVHENTIRNWIDRGILHAARLPSGTRKVIASDVERLEASMFPAPTSFAEVRVVRTPKQLPPHEVERPQSFPNL